MKTTLLFFSEAVTAAHVIRLYSLASALDKSRFDIHFAVADRYQHVFTDTDITHHTIHSIESAEFIRRVETAQQMYRFDELKRYVDEDIKVIDAVSPKIIFGDMRQSLCVSTRLKNIFYVALANAYWNGDINEYRFPIPEIRQINLSAIPFAHAFMSLYFKWFFKQQGKALSDLRKHYGLSPFRHCIDGWYFADFQMYSDPEALYDKASLTNPHCFLGPVTWEPDAPLPPWWDDLDASKKTVYVALGSSGDKTLLPALINGLVNEDFQVLVSGVDTPEIYLLPVHANVYSAALLPGTKAAHRADFIISNGGSPTSYQALAAGTPVVGVPRNLDQLLAMRFIEKNQLGLTLRPRSVGTNTQTQIFNQLMRGDYKARALAMADKINTSDVHDLFTQAIDELILKNHTRATRQ